MPVKRASFRIGEAEVGAPSSAWRGLRSGSWAGGSFWVVHSVEGMVIVAGSCRIGDGEFARCV